MASKSTTLPTDRTPHRFLGLDLAGAKNSKTTLSVIEYYPREEKTFLVDVYDKIIPTENQDADLALVELVKEIELGPTHLSVNVPLSLPPCLNCKSKTCRPGQTCSQASVKWMHEFVRKHQRTSLASGINVLPFTSYTQRPIEIWVRYGLFPHLPPPLRFEIDETLGGNKAPLTARMNYLKRAWKTLQVTEVWPKLSIVLLSQHLKLSKRVLQDYRSLESGTEARVEILEHLAAEKNIFIYDRDLKKLAHSLAAFDSFVCAYTGLLHYQGQTKKAPYGFPLETGWVLVPEWEEIN